MKRIDQHARLGDQAFAAIRDAIVGGRYPAGSRLQITALAEELGISMMPVREAITRLEEIGLVENRPYRGAVVKEATVDELMNIYSVRRALEVEATRQGTAHATPELVDDLRHLHRESVAAVRSRDFASFNDLDEQLLTRLYAAADNPLLTGFIDNLWDRCRFYKLVSTERDVAETSGDAGETSTLLLHDRLIDAVAAQDADAAAAVTQESITSAAERVRQYFADRAAG